MILCRQLTEDEIGEIASRNRDYYGYIEPISFAYDLFNSARIQQDIPPVIKK